MAHHPYGMTKTEDNIPFDEGQHPRGPDGRFIFAGGGSGYDFGGTSSGERPATGNRPWAGGTELPDRPVVPANRPAMRPYTAASFPGYAGESGGAAQIPIAAEVTPQREVAMGAAGPILQQGGRIGWNVLQADPVNGPEIEQDIAKLEEKQRTGTLTPEEAMTLKYQRKLREEFEESQRHPLGRKFPPLPIIEDQE